MKKFRLLINIGLIATLTIMTIVLFVTVLTTDSSLNIQHYLGIAFTVVTLAMLLVNKNIFTLLLGITLIMGNFCALSSLHALTTESFGFNIGSLRIPLYWGQPEYSLMLLIYLIFNKGFYIAFLDKKYWDGFLTRMTDFEPIVKTNPLAAIRSNERYLENVESFKNRFLNYTREQLNEIIDSNKYTPEAKKAAEDVINNKESDRNI